MRLITKAGEVREFRHYEYFRSAVSRGNPRKVYLTTAGRSGKLTVLADEGRLVVAYPSVDTAKRALANWISLHGLPLCVDGKACGKIGRHNPNLSKRSK
jgi:hypothetical protein